MEESKERDGYTGIILADSDCTFMDRALCQALHRVRWVFVFNESCLYPLYTNTSGCRCSMIDGVSAPGSGASRDRQTSRQLHQEIVNSSQSLRILPEDIFLPESQIPLRNNSRRPQLDVRLCRPPQTSLSISELSAYLTII